MLKEIQKEVEDLRIKVYAGQSLEDTEKALYEIEQMLFKAMDKQLNIPIVSQRSELFGERYPMTSNQPAQIDCRMSDCRFHKNGSCKNVAPALTFDDYRITCWTRISEPNCG